MRKAVAQLKTLLPNGSGKYTDRFLTRFLTRMDNDNLVEQAACGDEVARRRLLAKLRLSEVEARFWAYMKKTLQWETSRLLYEWSERAAVEALVLNEPVAGEDGSDRLARLAAPDNVAEAAVAMAATLQESLGDRGLWAAVRSLTARQRHVLELLYAADLTERQTARVLGISQQAVNKAKLAGLRHIRRQLHGGHVG